MIGRRILAFWLDFFLALFFTSVGIFLLRREILANTDPQDVFNPVRKWALEPGHPFVFLTGLFLYFFINMAASSETPGQALFGLTLVRLEEDRERKKIGWKRAFARTFMLSATLLTLGAGFLPVFANDRRLAMHDCLSGTRVVRERAFPAPPPAEPV